MLLLILLVVSLSSLVTSQETNFTGNSTTRSSYGYDYFNTYEQTISELVGSIQDRLFSWPIKNINDLTYSIGYAAQENGSRDVETFVNLQRGNYSYVVAAVEKIVEDVKASVLKDLQDRQYALYNKIYYFEENINFIKQILQFQNCQSYQIDNFLVGLYDQLYKNATDNANKAQEVIFNAEDYGVVPLWLVYDKLNDIRNWISFSNPSKNELLKYESLYLAPILQLVKDAAPTFINYAIDSNRRISKAIIEETDSVVLHAYRNAYYYAYSNC